MKINFGKLSILLGVIGVVIGTIGMFMAFYLLGIAYILVVSIAVYTILMSYCRKCPHSNNGSCVHGIPKKLFEKLPYKKTGTYTKTEIIMTMLAAIVVFIIPVYYLVPYSVMLLIYVGVWLSLILMIRLRVCRTCYNRWCLICPNRVKQ